MGSVRVPGLRYLYAGRTAPDPKWRMAAHSHDFHELITVLQGEFHVRGVGLDRDCREGDVLLYPAGVVHSECSSAANPVECVFMTFRWQGLAPRELACAEDRRGRMREIVRWLYEDRLSNDRSRESVRDALCAAAIAEFLSQPADDRDAIVERTRAWILEHLADSIALEDLAGREGLSRYHFIRRYKAASGRTPMEEVRAIRIDHARSLLLGTSLTLKEIAPLAGFANEYCLSRAFHRAVGASPSSLRSYHDRRPRGGSRARRPESVTPA
jgi:AraC-like DNA-binding protein